MVETFAQYLFKYITYIKKSSDAGGLKGSVLSKREELGFQNSIFILHLPQAVNLDRPTLKKFQQPP